MSLLLARLRQFLDLRVRDLELALQIDELLLPRLFLDLHGARRLVECALRLFEFARRRLGLVLVRVNGHFTILNFLIELHHFALVVALDALALAHHFEFVLLLGLIELHLVTKQDGLRR